MGGIPFYAQFVQFPDSKLSATWVLLMRHILTGIKIALKTIILNFSNF